jgi:signal-transduction protein with cAMP-binding, CBS, and nucleotidyltransferase domain
MKMLTENNFTTLGTEQFIVDTRLMMLKVKDVIKPVNPLVSENMTITDALVKMTEFGFGAVTVIDGKGKVKGVFTDGTLRRLISEKGHNVVNQTLNTLTYRDPITIDANALLNDANQMFKKYQVDTLVVTSDGKPVGMIDIQDI